MNLEVITIKDFLKLQSLGKCVVIEDGHVVEVRKE